MPYSRESENVDELISIFNKLELSNRSKAKAIDDLNSNKLSLDHNKEIKLADAVVLGNLKCLTSLSLRGCELGDNEVAPLNNLAILDLSGNNIGPQGAKILANSYSLTDLNLWGNSIGNDGAEFLAMSKSIKKLNLWSNKIESAGMQALAKNPYLASLNMGYNGKVDVMAASAFASNSYSLDDLHLGSTDVGDKEVETLSKGYFSSLHLERNKISDVGAGYLARSNHLTNLSMDCNQFTSKGIKELASNTSITTLSLSNSKVGDVEAEWLAKNSTLHNLKLKGNCISDAGLKYLLNSDSLISLDLEGNKIKGLELQNDIASNTSLTHLDLGGNEISSVFLVESTSLTSLNISNNKLSREEMNIIYDNVINNKNGWLLHVENQIERIQRILSANVEGVNNKHSSGKTAMHFACIETNIGKIYTLLQHGAWLDALDNKCKHPLDYLNISNADTLKEMIKMGILLEDRVPKFKLSNNEIEMLLNGNVPQVNTGEYFANIKMSEKNVKMLENTFKKVFIAYDASSLKRTHSIEKARLAGISSLILHNCEINNTYVKKQLSVLLRSLTCLRELNLSNNAIGGAGLKFLYTILQHSGRQLQSLDVSGNFINNKKQELINDEELQKFCCSLNGECTIDLSGNCIAKDNEDVLGAAGEFTASYRRRNVTLLFSKMLMDYDEYDKKRDCLDSVVSPKSNITNYNWIVALACRKTDNHARIFLEGLEHGQRFIHMYHLVSSKGKIVGRCDIKIEDKTSGAAALHQDPNYWFKCKEIIYTDGKTLQQKVKMSQASQDDLKFSLLFPSTFGENSVNCLEWAKKLLIEIDIDWAREIQAWKTPNQAAREGNNGKDKCLIM